MGVQSGGHILGSGFYDRQAGLFQRLGEGLVAKVVPLADDLEHVLDRGEKRFPVGPRFGVGQGGQVFQNSVFEPQRFRKVNTIAGNSSGCLAEAATGARLGEPGPTSWRSGCAKLRVLVFDVADQMGNAELYSDVEILYVLVLGGEVVVAQDAVEFFAEYLAQHFRAAGFFNLEQHVEVGVESAAGRTLFLDEIGDLQPEVQVRLLRLLQEGEYLPLLADHHRKLKARLLFVTNCDLSKRVENGTFRRDLYYRLARHQVCVPPLRERFGDLPVLLQHFVARACEAIGKPVPKIPRTLFAFLRQYSFPGNIRELESLVYDALCQTTGETLEPHVFAQKLGLQQEETPAASSQDANAVLQIGEPFPTLKDATAYLVDEGMKRTGQKQTATARLLGISQQVLSQRLKRR